MVETDDVAQLKALILAQQEEITALKAVIADLTARLSQNSANSHKPPSSDRLAKKPPGVPFTNNQAERDCSGGPAAAREGETAGKRLLSY